VSDVFLKQNVLLQQRGDDAAFCKYRSGLTASSIDDTRIGYRRTRESHEVLSST